MRVLLSYFSITFIITKCALSVKRLTAVLKKNFGEEPKFLPFFNKFVAIFIT